MTNPAMPIKTDKSSVSPETQKQIDSHKKAATHLEAAAKSHSEAATHHEQGNDDKAAKSAMTAHGHTALATETQRTAVKNHAAHVK